MNIDEQSTDIAIIGLAGRFPGARNIDEFWQNLRNGVESISFFSDEELLSSGVQPALLQNPRYIRANGILDDIELFDASFFGYSPREAAMLDPQQRLFLEDAWKALEHAGYDAHAYQGAIGVYAGCNASSYMFSNLLKNAAFQAEAGMFQTMLNNDKDFLATRTSYKLNLKGPSITVQTACSTSLVAVHMAIQSLLQYECDIALAGGASISIPQKIGYLYEEESITSPDGHCRAFDADARGTVGGSGVGIVVLKRLADALNDGDTIHAIIRGSAVNNDGATKVGYTAPSVEGQAKVITEALALADVEPETISYIEAHGTGTLLGDPIELVALTQAFRASTPKCGYCAIGSVKTNIGHLDAAAGIAGLIKVVLSLKHRTLPPSLHFRHPNPKIDFAHSPFYVNTQTVRWETGNMPRRAGVSSFGIGGTNAHVIVEEAPATVSAPASQREHIVVLSARTPSALEKATEQLATHIGAYPETNLADVAYTLQTGRRTFQHRRTFMASNLADMYDLLKSNNPQRVFTNTGTKKVTFLFPGQGAQHIHMAADLYRTMPAFREHIDHCASLLQPLVGYDLRTVLFPVPEKAEEAAQQLNMTSTTQVALFTVEYALARLLMHLGVQPQAMLGHSLGEYVAACLADVFSLEDALRLVSLRGKLMQDMPGGSMLAVSLPEREILPLLPESVALAACNSPNFCVVSGPMGTIAEVEAQLHTRGVETRRLRTSHAFHSSMMEPMLHAFALVLQTIQFHTPKIPYLANVTGTWITAEQATDPNYWVTHVRQTVRFTESLQELLQVEGQMLLEVGPGRSLSTFARQTFAPSAPFVTLPLLPDKRTPANDTLFMQKLQQLWLHGIPVNWAPLYNGQRRSKIALPTYPFERQRHWIDPAPRVSPASMTTMQEGARHQEQTGFFSVLWKQQPLPDVRHQNQRLSWLIFSDVCGVGQALAERLQQLQQDVTLVTVGSSFTRLHSSTYTLNPMQVDSYDALVAQMQVDGKHIDKIVHAWNITAEPATLRQADIEAAQLQGFYSLLELVKALGKARENRPITSYVLSTHLQDVTGEEQLDPAKATLLGLCKTLPQEYRNITCCCIDLALPSVAPSEEGLERCVTQLLHEFACPEKHPIVAYRGRHRWIPVLEALPWSQTPASPSQRLRPHGTYLITGGRGKMGLTLASAIAQRIPATLVLVNRSAFPQRHEWISWLKNHPQNDARSDQIRQILKIEENGARVVICQADVANKEQMLDIWQDIQGQYGTIYGVIHAAGSIGRHTFAPVQESDRLRCEEQFRAKVYGTLVLGEILRSHPVDFCVLQSSLASILGGLGFSAYAAANAFMDAFAHHQHYQTSQCWQSINWDGWQFTEKEDTSGEKSAMRALDNPITPQFGRAAFEQVLHHPSYHQVIVSRTDVQRRREQWIELEDEAPVTASGLSLSSRPQLSNAYVAPTNETEQTICRIWQQLLGIEAIGIHDNFFDLGGHSLLGTQVITRLRDAFQVDLSLRVLFEEPTVACLALLIIQKKAEQLDDELLLQALEDLENLSDEAAQALLAIDAK